MAAQEETVLLSAVGMRVSKYRVLDYTSYSTKQQCVKVINDIHKTQEGYLKSHPDEAANGNPFHAVCIP